jgi:uncharacterized membrane protein
MAREMKTDRLTLFTDGVFAVVITILVLELKPPRSSNLDGLVSLWPTAMSYAISYLFIAIVWVNHHHLFRYAEAATNRLIWVNFAHLFSVSLIPFSTAWIAQTELAPIPVSLYAGIFVLVNATYLLLCMEAIDRPRPPDLTIRTVETRQVNRGERHEHIQQSRRDRTRPRRLGGRLELDKGYPAVAIPGIASHRCSDPADNAVG